MARTVLLCWVAVIGLWPAERSFADDRLFDSAYGFLHQAAEERAFLKTCADFDRKNAVSYDHALHLCERAATQLIERVTNILNVDFARRGWGANAATRVLAEIEADATSDVIKMRGEDPDAFLASCRESAYAAAEDAEQLTPEWQRAHHPREMRIIDEWR